MKKKKRKRKNKLIIIIVLVVIVLFCKFHTKNKNAKKEEPIENQSLLEEPQNVVIHQDVLEVEGEPQIEDWRLVLVNQENILPSNFAIELEEIDKNREFDCRAINELRQMINNMQQDGITNVWIQSAYRSVERQAKLFERKVNEYEAQGKTHEEAEAIVLQTINRPGMSEHNLGLAVDFNYVDYSFDETAGFKWLKENAENYGFVLRYAREKETITKVDYEPWHWRYVGKEHAIKMNELGLCLEEYVEYLKK